MHAPTSGPGGSGYKLFKYYKEARVDALLKFDKSKNTLKRKRDAGEVTLKRKRDAGEVMQP